MLLIRPDHIGDVLLTAPAVALLRASLPLAHLTYVVGPWSLEAARNGPSVDEIRTLPFPAFTRRPKKNVVAPYATLLGASWRLRREAFDLAIVFRPDDWWGALLALASGIPLRVGGQTPETQPLLTHTYDACPDEHAAQRALALAHLALDASQKVAIAPDETVPQFRVSDEARDSAGDLFRRLGLNGQAVVAVHPSAGAPLKSWPISNWARLADALIDQNMTPLLTGGPADEPLLSAIASRMRRGVRKACGQSLDGSAAIFERCALLLCVDGGAGHLAAAVDTPTVRLYGPAPPDVFGPWPQRQDQRVLLTDTLACAPCGDLESPPCGARELPACMLALTVEDVLNAVSAQLNQG